MAFGKDARLANSPTVWMAAILVIIYLTEGIVGGSILQPDLNAFYLLLQVNELVWQGAAWMLFTSMFLHADILHIGGNVLFLLLFGTALEEQISPKRWVFAYLASGLVGNLAFLLLGGDAIGLGASGAIWGLLGAAGGIRGLVGMIFYGGLNIFAGGGVLAHAGGLVAGLATRYSWLRRPLSTHADAPD